MDEQHRQQLNARAVVLKAMAHPTRLFIIEELAQRECSVSELTAMVGADVSTVSKHLAQLKQTGLVCDDKRGNQVFYRLAVPCILNFFGCVEAVLAEQHQQRGAVLKRAVQR